MKRRFIKILSASIAISLLFGTTVFADYFGGTRYINANNEVRYYYSPSIINYHYDGDISSASVSWNNASNSKQIRVTIWESLSNGPNIDEYYISSTDDINELGLTDPYKKDFWGNNVACGINDNWSFCRVYFYDNNILRWGPDQRLRTITHEMGHSLKLAHPSSSVTSDSVMWQSRHGGSMTPTTYDANQLYSKWGHR